MKYLGLALFREGPTDHRFLNKLILRTAHEICLKASEAVEVGDVLELRSPSKFIREDRSIRILEAAREAIDAFNVLFIHADGGSDAEKAKINLVLPATELIVRELGKSGGKQVAVIPVRETEAWAIVDGEALRWAFGTTRSNTDLGVPDPTKTVENILDPKSALEKACQASVGHRKNGKKKAAKFLDLLGERVNLHILRRVPAFQHFEKDLSEALKELRFIP